ncbi:MAG: exopolysaccharide biosynthesis polyprenyl glycosylphosphotransferase [Oscillospiraceae bacterium]
MNKDQLKRFVSNLLSLVIIFVLTYLYSLIWSLCYAKTIPDPFWNKGNWLVIAIYAIVAYAFMKIYGSKNIGDWRIIDIIYSQCLSVVFLNLFTYLLISLINRWFANFWPLIWLTVFDFICVFCWTVIAKYLYRKIYPPREVLLIYGDRDPDDLINKMNTRKDKYNLCEFISVSVGIDIVKNRMKQYSSVIICDLPADLRNDMVKFCYRESIRAYVTPKLSDIILFGADNSNIFDSPLLICKNRGIRIERRIIKRIMDLLVIIPVAVLTLPFNLIFATLIKLYDGGNVFYKQERLTVGGKIFFIYKFRSMKMNSEQGVAQLAKKNDGRITPIGKFLRKTHLDELPQIINILRGEMSVVGPRPERPEIAAEYKKLIPEFDFRLHTKAGLTGYAQVFGKYNTSPYDKLKLDLYYIEHQSTLLDIELILKTLRILVTRDNTEGVSADQTTAMKNKNDGDK